MQTSSTIPTYVELAAITRVLLIAVEGFIATGGNAATKEATALIAAMDGTSSILNAIEGAAQ